MAQLALAVGGGAAGGAFFGRTGAMVGFLTGSLIGAWLFAPRTTVEGPRLEDLNVSVSTYGAPIPIGYGTPRMPGNVIWSTGLIETRNKNKVGGKGGPSTTQVSYTYSASFAIAFAKRSSIDVLRIWADTKLIHDKTAPGGVASDTVSKGEIEFRYYNGSETQNVDPTIEAVEGVDNSPAYRGITYIVFDNMPLADFGNRIPSITAEIAFEGVDTFPVESITPSVASGTYPRGDSWLHDKIRNFGFIVYGDKITKYDLTTGDELGSGTLPASIKNRTFQFPALDSSGAIYSQGGSSNYEPIYKIDPNTFEVVAASGTTWGGLGWRRHPNFGQIFIHTFPSFGTEGEVGIVIGNVFRSVSFFATKKFSTDPIKNEQYGVDELRYYGNYTIAAGVPNMIAVDKNERVWLCVNDVGNSTSKLTRLTITLTENPDLSTNTGTPLLILVTDEQDFDLSASIDSCEYMTYTEDEHALLIGTTNTLGVGNTLIKFDITSESVVQTYNGQGWGSNSFSTFVPGVQNGKFLVGNGNDGRILDVATFDELTEQYTWNNWGSSGGGRRGFFYHEPSGSVYFITGDEAASRYFLDRLSGVDEPLDELVADLCDRNGLDASLVDVVDLASDTVRAYAIARQSNGRNAINPLALAYAFDAVESDWILKFRKRGQAASFTIPEADLAVHSGMGRRPDTNLKESFIQESELPQALYVTYSDYNRDYQEGTQYARRNADVVTTHRKQDVQFPITFTATEAKKIAHAWLFALWNEQSNIEFQVGTKWLLLDPTDRGTVTNGSVTHTVRLIGTDLGDYQINAEAVVEDSDTWTAPDVTGDAGDFPDQALTLPGPTELFVLDIPLLLDSHSTARESAPLYFAPAAYSSNWTGAAIFKSSDGTTFDDILFSSSVIDWGVLTTALAESDGWATWDRFRFFRVKTVNGANPASATELAVLNGANAAAVGNETDGWEILQFATVTDEGGDVYKIENLLRGRRGTNNSQAHSIGDYFILLNDPDILLHTMELAEIDTTRFFRAVTLGATFDNQDVDTVEFAANSLKPYSPAFVQGERGVIISDEDDLTITWKRRTRVGGAWANKTGTVPLAEGSEEYEIDILNGDTVVRTETGLTSTAYVYTAADQIADFGSVQASVDVQIYQISDVVGRGFVASATL